MRGNRSCLAVICLFVRGYSEKGFTLVRELWLLAR